MAELTEKQRAFFREMLKGDENERHGVDLLIKRPDYAEFFDVIEETGLFDPRRNPAPREGDKPGYFWIPYWHILDYLKAVAKKSGEGNNLALAQKVMGVVRTVTAHPAEKPLSDNSHTANTFLDILSLVPTAAVTLADIALIPRWMSTSFGKSLIGHGFAERILPRFVQSQEPRDWEKASEILRHGTTIVWKDANWPGSDRREPEAAIDDYWLKQMIDAVATPLGTRAGNRVVPILLERVREVYSSDVDRSASWIARPAIENHEQNHTWDGVHNDLVRGIRDMILSWMEANPAEAKPYVDRLLTDDSQIVRRIAIHIIDEKFPLWRDQLLDILTPALLDAGVHHESYRLLTNHFHEFPPEAQAQTLELIRQLPADGDERTHKRNQWQWLSAIQGHGSKEVDQWYRRFENDGTLGILSPHPDLHSYHVSRWGPGNSPYGVQELLQFREDGSLIQKLNNFVEPGTWEGPTEDALCDAVDEATRTEPARFLGVLPDFLGAKRQYQYALISGFKKIWELPIEESQKKIKWNDAWPLLFTFFENLLGNGEFWGEDAPERRNLIPTRDWIPGIVAEFVRSGVRDDKKSFDAELLPRSWALIDILLRKAEAHQSAGVEDPMTAAINSAKGKAVEALFDHALRACRVSDAATEAHERAWEEMRPTFDRELNACRNANFEFSTLAAAYVAQIRYMSERWYNERFAAIFPEAYPSNRMAALGGLAYAPAKTYIYTSLMESGVLVWALQQEMRPRDGRKNLLHRVALAFLWDRERIDGPALGYLFAAGREDDLGVIAHFFWTIGGDKLDPERVQDVILFWERCVEWARGREQAPTKLFSELSLLACHLAAIGERELRLLLAVAAYVSVDFNADHFIEELGRLASRFPGPAGQVLEAMLGSFKPTFDFEDHLKKLLTTLSEHRESRQIAIKAANEFRRLPGMLELYRRLASEPPV